MAGPLIELYEFFDEEGDMLNNGGYKAGKVRKFVREFGEEFGLDSVAEYAVYNTFIENNPDVEITKSYFHTICSRAWKTFADENNKTFIDLTHQNEIKPRECKI